ncbi:MAG: septum formation inhibitor Maf [Oscillospiraceae bacterium]|nr:septum formation inhibitor Maf [Oscillospiraceae bacterium]
MACSETRLVLASASPRRRELLARFGVPFEVIPARGAEPRLRDLSPGALVRTLAAGKAAEVASALPDDAVVIAADTVVELDGEILGKPGTPEKAAEMLRALSGRENRVWSGLVVRRGGVVLTADECTRVRFRTLSEEEIAAYVATGEPLDKAGAYGYQGLASLFVESIDGDYFNVVGLPLCRLGMMLRELGVELL